MNDSGEKYFRLMGMLILSVVGFAALLVIIFYVLKVFAIAVFQIPGVDFTFRLVTLLIPYLVLYGAYYIVHKKITAAANNASSYIARLLLIIGSAVLIGGMIIELLEYFKIKTVWIQLYSSFSHHVLVAHLLLLLLASGILATGTAPEKNWMDREQN